MRSPWEISTEKRIESANFWLTTSQNRLEVYTRQYFSTSSFLARREIKKCILEYIAEIDEWKNKLEVLEANIKLRDEAVMLARQKEKEDVGRTTEDKRPEVSPSSDGCICKCKSGETETGTSGR